ncbi:AarF/UbiB family protein [Gammaproteobacteria bacterium]|nr:AarF/UbiB family protein [Gammaproteobacteria bacterium]
MYQRTKRLLLIIYTLFHYQLDQLILPRYLQLSRILFWRKRKAPGEALYQALTELGPLFIKAGQLISIRYDLFPSDIVNSLTKLQDQVPQTDYRNIITCIECELSQPAGHIFRHIDQIPIGCGSIAQVHRAILHTGEEVAVKVLRPNIKSIITLDLEILKFLTRFATNRSVAIALIQEYEFTIQQELNLKQEGAHYTQTKQVFEGDSRLYVPIVYWEYTTNKILVTELIKAVNLRDIHKYHLPNITQLATNGLEIFLTQVFEHRFFHADMHPGNIFIDISNPQYPKYIAIDFGIIGIINEVHQYYLVEIFIGLYRRDYAKVTNLFIRAKWVNPNINAHHFESALRGVCEPIFAIPIGDISMAELMQQLILASKQFGLQLPAQLLMLQKTLFHVEAMGRKIDPNMNIMHASSHYMKTLLSKRKRLLSTVEKLKSTLPYLLENLPYTTDKKPATETTRKQNIPFIALLLGSLLSAPYQLTKPYLIYIITNIIIITVTWKKLRPKDFA